MKLHSIRDNATGSATWGCMWKMGEIPSADILNVSYKCINNDGLEVNTQTRITAYWPDGSVKWTAHTADSDKLGNGMEVSLVKVSDPMQIHKGILKKAEEINNDVYFESDDEILVKGSTLTIKINKKSNRLFEEILNGDRLLMKDGCARLKLEEPKTEDGNEIKIVRDYVGRIDKVTVEETGSVQTIIKYEGIHECCQGDRQGDTKIPFVIRMIAGSEAGDVRFQHTFMYDGDENKDFLKGIGISFESPITGSMFNRHIKYIGDYGVFHEVCVPMQSWRPKLPQEMYVDQLAGKKLEFTGEVLENTNIVLQATPYWDTYSLTQDSPSHFKIKKKLAHKDGCYIDSLHGNRSLGGCAFGGENGSILIGVRDFWEKYPAGVTVAGLSQDMVTANVWFYSPETESFDFRHYAERGYNQVCYEGYDYKGADAVGIACTSECALSFSDDIIPSDERLTNFAENINHPPIYVGTPEFYHEMKAFGYWSLPSYETESERWLEDQLEKAFEFYKAEIDQRGWYGIFNYGDFMHTYDGVRHQWKYDIGGYAWDNTELVPTLWLWNYFLRTGREDVFTMAEKLSRHASEVDVYHFGKYKGLGSRHNVRHWGCPCKEARIAMAAHHRVLYYLTGDRRLEDIFDELKDNEFSFLNKDPLGDFFDKKDMVYPSHARSGPDWSSLVSNWMTEWERHNDPKYREKIMIGIRDIEKTPMQLVSGPDFEFDPETVHLRYIGERTTGGCHLQVCMGAPSVWSETADLLDEEFFKKMIADLGRMALLPREQQLEETNGIIGNREFTYPFMFSGIAAYGAAYYNDREGALRAWQSVLASLISENSSEGFKTKIIANSGNHENLSEVPWITTNFVAQWCLNIILVLEFIREDLPADIETIKKLVVEKTEIAFHNA